jgi:UDP-N-acetylmuramoyl-tripeptide--D-alanyl-D-alanine ligase
MRWSPAAVALAAGGSLTVPPDAPVAAAADAVLCGVGIDSRLLPAGALFVALRAARDGHEWVDAAVAVGAGGVLVDHAWHRSRPRADISVPLVAVADTAAALLALGRAGRDRLAATVVGITGSVGKTSTKDLATAALSSGLRTTASEKSFNNELGVPLTLANAELDVEAAVIEMGARGRGHIARLCGVARPDIGVVTAVAAAHTEAFGDIDGVA